MAKKQSFTTPKGVALFPALRTPDSRPIKGKPQEPAWKIKLKLEGKAFEEFKAIIDPLVQASYDQAVADAKPQKKKLIQPQYPYTPEYDDNGDETGAYFVNFKKKAKFKKNGVEKDAFPPTLFDAKGKPLPSKVDPWTGSIVRVNFTPNPYLVDSTNGAGVTLYLNAVQVIELAQGGGGNAKTYGFEEEEGFEYEDDGSDESPFDTAEDDASEEDSDF